MKGTNGCEYCLSFDSTAAGPELVNTPKITGCCATSPSRKNPRTVSPGDILIGLLLPALPEPDSGDIINCEFPRIDMEKRKGPDEIQSGLYMIKKLTHFFDAKGSYTKLQLARDTNGRKAK